MELSDTDYRDIQGLVRFGHGPLKAARFHLLTIADAVAARQWLAVAPVTSAVKNHPPETALQIALTYDGLRALDVAPDVLGQFPYEFITGMAEPSRSRRLGDIATNDPKHWRWGGPGQVPHALVLLYATTNERLDDWEKKIKDQNWNAAFSELQCLSTHDEGDIEPFGFADGISQPALDWERKKSQRVHNTTVYTNLSALGEFLLGYPNEYGKYTDRPFIDPSADPQNELPLAEDRPGKKDLGRNGTYLVLRDLVQDVPGFWQFVVKQAGQDRQEQQKLAGAIVGRMAPDIPAGTNDKQSHILPPGSPIVPLSNDAIDGVGPDLTDIWRNQFTFHKDPEATTCPYGAHIRRANPRNADLPEGTRGLPALLLRILGYGRENQHEDLIASTCFHRILRRGREYGIRIEPGKPTPESAERGLRFIGLNANISRQFEFIQASWLANAKFEGLDEDDPVVGGRAPIPTGGPTDTFTRPQTTGLCRRVAGVPQFVTVRGGAYFFMPGLSALRYLVRTPR